MPTEDNNHSDLFLCFLIFNGVLHLDAQLGNYDQIDNNISRINELYDSSDSDSENSISDLEGKEYYYLDDNNRHSPSNIKDLKQN